MTDLTNLANDIQAVKSDLANAISLKGVPCTTNDAFNSYSDKVNSIQSGYFAGVNLANITSFPSNGYMAFYNMDTIQGPLMFNSLTTISSSQASIFSNCQGITEAYFPNLSYANYFPYFMNCHNLTNAYFPSLISTGAATVGLGGVFADCYNLTTINFDSFGGGVYVNGMFANCNHLTHANFPAMTNGSQANYMFWNCYNLISFSAPNCSYISNMTSMFCNCYNLTEVNLSSLANIALGQNSFKDCHNLESFSLPNYSAVLPSFSSGFTNCYKLQSFNANCSGMITGALISAFWQCNSLTNFSFSVANHNATMNSFRSCFANCVNFQDTSFLAQFNVAMTNAFTSCFSNCFALNGQSIYFNSLVTVSGTPFTNMLYGISDSTVHFKSELQSVIGSSADVLAGFGGTNTTVLFDL